MARTAAQGTQAAQVQQAPAITEDQLRQQFQGKTFYLRDGYLDNTLHFDQDGRLDGNSPKASFTLSLVQIERVHLEKHKLALEAVRYGLHFLGASLSEGRSEVVDKVRLTSKKRPLRIVINREVVAKLKPPKQNRHAKNPQTLPDSPTAALAEVTETDRHGMRITSSQQHANQALQQALDRIFSPEVDERMIGTLPEYWRLYYQSLAQKSSFRPSDAAVLRESQVDLKPRLISAIEPQSNDFAQNNGVAGPALYRVVLGADGRPQTIAVGRPIGFGLDENAVESIRTAKFEPAMKDGKPVPVMIDVTVQFRIYSTRTAGMAETPQALAVPEAKKPELPGPYTAHVLLEQQKSAEQTNQRQSADQSATQPAAPQADAQKPASAQPQPAPQ